MREVLRGRYDDGLDVGGEPAVRVGGALLGVEVGHVAHTTHYVMYPEAAAGIDGEAVVIDDAYTLHAPGGLSDYFLLLSRGIESAFVLVDADGDDNLVKDRKSPLENVEMSFGERVE